jgi:galactose mutarotase-like enzyme
MSVRPEPIVIGNGSVTAAISPFGAELVSLTDASGAEWMHDGDSRWWSGRAPLLFPNVGALADNRLRHGGRDYGMEKHGFARRSLFAVDAVAADSVRFTLTDSDATRALYPFMFRLDVDFRVAGTTLHTIATVSNNGDEPLPFSFGYHPAFVWPLPGGGAKGDHRLTFDKPEDAPIRAIVPATGLMLPDPLPSPLTDGRSFAPDATHFAGDALIWDRLNSRSLTWGVPGGTLLRVGFPDMAMLGLWQVPGAPYLCIEPWAGHADPVGYDGDFVDKPGVTILPPGESCAYRMDLTLMTEVSE